MQGTQSDLAELLKISTRRIRELAKDRGMFASKTGSGSGTRYDLGECVQEYINFRIEFETGGKNDLDYWEEKAKHEEAKRKITQIKLSRMRRDSFDAVDVEEAWSLLVLDFREKLLVFPHKLAPLLIGEEDLFRITQIIEEQVENALTDLSRFGVDAVQSNEELPEDDEKEDFPVAAENGAPVTAAKKANRKPVGGRKSKAPSG